jgi:hypothetical protein
VCKAPKDHLTGLAGREVVVLTVARRVSRVGSTVEGDDDGRMASVARGLEVLALIGAIDVCHRRMFPLSIGAVWIIGHEVGQRT